jgi:uncharacterized repeat protein (TIGR01451 family)
MKTKTFVALVLTAIVLFTPKTTLAQYYGNNSDNPSVVVDKKIKLPNSNKFFDNVSKSDYVFKEGDQIEFSVVVENRGDETLYDVKVVDLLPDYLKLQYYFGNLVSNGEKVETTIPVLKKGESKNYSVIAIVKNLPNSSYSQTYKQTNEACASNSRVNDCDKSSYFVQTPSMPVTGGSIELIVNSGLLLTLGGGSLVLRKLVRGY